MKISGKLHELPVGKEAMIYLSDGQAITSVSGEYSFEVENGSSYIVTPVLPGCAFKPLSKVVVVLNADVANVDFVDPPQYSPWLGIQAAGRKYHN